MIDGIDRFLVRLSCAQVAALAMVGILLVGAVDVATGRELLMGLFYLGPVTLAAWYGGKRAGLAIALAAGGAWLLADTIGGVTYSHPAIPFWNGLVRLGFFLVTSSLLSALRVHLDAERRLARIDGLTGVFNRQAFIERLEYALALAAREQRPLTLAYVDVDNFKRINDRHGHEEGDRVLRIVAQTLVNTVRRTDIVARLGGDEFAVLLTGADLAGSERILRKTAQALEAAIRAAGHETACSIGAAMFTSPPARAGEAIAAADALMYKAKASGKHAVVLELWTPAAAPSHAQRHAARAAASAKP